MSTVDLVIKNCLLCFSTNTLKVSLAIDQGKIVGIGSSEHLPKSDRTIKADGMFVIPGFIDAHVHTRDPGYTWKEDFESATRCAAFSGVTTIVDMPNVKPEPVTVENFKKKRKICKEKAVVDFNHWASPLVPKEIPGIVNEGAVGFKIFMKESKAYPYNTGASSSNLGLIYEAFQAIADSDLPCIIHPYIEDIYKFKVKKFRSSGVKDLQTYMRAIYAPEVQVSIVPTLIYLAQRTGVKLGILHGESKEIFEFVTDARNRGQIVYQELNPYSLWTIQKESIAYGKLSILLSESDNKDVSENGLNNFTQEAWRMLLSDEFLEMGYVASDHAPHLEKEFIGVDPEKAQLGWGDMLSFYPLLFFTAINRGIISLWRVVKLCSENPAKMLGLYPSKGSIQVGSDADLVILDMKKKYTISKSISNSKCGWSIWDGKKVQGAPKFVILRGKTINEMGQVIGEKGYGKFIKPMAK